MFQRCTFPLLGGAGTCDWRRWNLAGGSSSAALAPYLAALEPMTGGSGT